MKKHSIISLETLLAWMICLPLLNDFPAFFYPRGKTFFDLLPDWIKNLAGSPTNALVNNPIALCLVSLGCGVLVMLTVLDLANSQSRLVHLLRGAGIGFLIVLLVIIPTFWEMYNRHLTSPHLHAHDGGVLQTEEAMKMLLSGKNPYTESYLETPMFGYARRNPQDPPLHHLPYLPWVFTGSVPFFVLVRALTGWFDQRVVYLLYYLAALLALPLLVDDPRRRRLAVLCFGLNPFLVPFIVQGRNDSIPLALMVVVMVLLERDRLKCAGFVLGVAMASKQFIWLLAPFLLTALAGGWRWSAWRARRRQVLEVLIPCVLGAAVLIGPFLMWDFASFKDDVFDFNSGKSEISYALGGTPGYGFANFALYHGWVQSRNDYFPFWPFMLAAMVPLSVVVLLRLERAPSFDAGLVGGALVLLGSAFFARLLHDNHLGFILGLLVVAHFGDRLHKPNGERLSVGDATSD
ncbi:hypothetical protein JW905_18990 [bacterium]|nr:hypothetical protein [candidate division CSSED10-310 bacterium]